MDGCNIILTIDSGKVVILRFDAYTSSLSPLHLYNAEEGAIGTGSEVRADSHGRRVFPGVGSNPYLCTDVAESVACVMIYSQQLLFIPLQPYAVKVSQRRLSTATVSSSAAALPERFVVDLQQQGLQLFGILLDVCFVSGCSKPTVAILQEHAPLPVGHAADVSNTCSVTVLALDIPSKSASILWQQANLPADSFKLLSLPTASTSALRSSVMLLSTNAALVISSSAVAGLSTNGFAAVTVAKSFSLQPWQYAEGIELSGCCAVEAERDCVLVSLLDGRLLLINIFAYNDSAVGSDRLKFESSFLATSVRASCLSVCRGRGLWFVGSRAADGLLVRVATLTQQVRRPVAWASVGTRGGATSAVSPQAKKSKKSVGAADGLKEEELLYGHVISTDTCDLCSVTTFSLTIDDRVPVLGPVLDGIFSGSDDIYERIRSVDWSKRVVGEGKEEKSVNSASAYIVEREAKDTLQLTAGVGSDGSIARVHKGLRLAKIASRNFPGATNVHSVNCPALPQCGPLMLVSTLSNRTRVLQCSLSQSNADIAVKELASASDIGLVGSEATVGAGLVADTALVQALASGLHLVKLSAAGAGPAGSCSLVGEVLQGILMADSEEVGGLGGGPGDTIVAVDCCPGWVVVTTSARVVCLLEYDEKEASLLLRQKGAHRAALHVASDFCGGDMCAALAGEPTAASLFFGYFPCAAPAARAAKKSNEPASEELFLYGDEPKAATVEAKAAPKPSRGKKRKGSDSAEVEAVIEQAEGAAAAAAAEATDLPVPPSERVHKAYLVLGDAAGFISVLLAEDMSIVARSRGFGRQLALVPSHTAAGAAVDREEEEEPFHAPADLRLVRLGPAGKKRDASRLCLSILSSNDDLSVYCGNEVEGRMNFWSRLEHASITRKRRSRLSRGGDDAEFSSNCKLVYMPDMDGRNAVSVSGAFPLVIFNDSGLPHVMPLSLPELPFVNAGTYMVQPLKVGDIAGVASFWQEHEIIDSAKTQTKQSILGIYQTTPGLQVLGAQDFVTVKRISARSTVHRMQEIQARTDDKTEQALLKKKTYVLSCSDEVRRPFLPSVLTKEEQEREESTYDRFHLDFTSFAQPDRASGAPPPTVGRQYKLAILQDGVAVDVFNMPVGEHVLGVEVLYLTLERTQNLQTMVMTRKPLRKVFVAVCTGSVDKHGEDTQGEGRLLLFALDYAIFHSDAESEAAEGERPPEGAAQQGGYNAATATKAQSAAQAKFLSSIQPKLRLMWTGPGPASVVKQFGENILSTVGSVVYIYRLNPDSMELEQVSFFFAKFYIASVTILKNYIMISDVMNSVQFLVWRDEDRSLTLVSRNFDNNICVSTGFVYDSSALGMVIGDDECNLELLQFNPHKIESRRGSRLLGLADMHLGATANVLLPHCALGLPNGAPPALLIDGGNQLGRVPTDPRGRRILPPNTLPFGSRFDKLLSPRSVLTVATAGGSLGVLVPVDERLYRRLAVLQQLMAVGVPTPCGLNPREFRLMKTSRYKIEKKKGILDGNLLWKYVSLETALQQELAEAMGISSDTIMDSLQEIEYHTTFF